MLNFSAKKLGTLFVARTWYFLAAYDVVTCVIDFDVRKRLPVKTQLVCPGNDEENWSSEVRWQLDGRNMEHSNIVQ